MFFHNHKYHQLSMMMSLKPPPQDEEITTTNPSGDAVIDNNNWTDLVAPPMIVVGEVIPSSVAAVVDDSSETSMNQKDTMTKTFAKPETQPTANENNLLWKAVVVILCAVWASNFAVIKMVVSEPGVDSSLYAVARFGLATAALLPFAAKQWRPSTTTKTTTNIHNNENSNDATVLGEVTGTGMDKETFWGAIGCGAWVAFGYTGQLLGLLTTTASKSCVICSLHCVFVAAFAEFVRSQKSQLPFNVQVLLPAALAVTGVGIVELSGGAGTANIGDLLSFAQPIGFGMGYLQLEGLMARRPDLAVPVSAIKLGMVALASLLYFEVGPWLQPQHVNMDSILRVPDFEPILHSPIALAGVAYTGLVTTALALWVESIAFARVSATTASLILTTEPIFAAGLGALLLGETFGGSDYLGATCIVGACVLATLMDKDNGQEELSEEPIKDTPSRKWPFWGF